MSLLGFPEAYLSFAIIASLATFSWNKLSIYHDLLSGAIYYGNDKSILEN